MVEREILKYLREGEKKGLPFLELKNSLLASGWSESEVLEAWNSLYDQPKKPIVYSRTPVRNIILYGGLILLGVMVFILFLVFNESEVVFSEEDIGEGINFEIVRKPVKLSIDSGEALMVVDKTFTNYTKVKINSITYSLEVGQDVKIDLNSDGVQDLLIRLEGIKAGVPEFFVGLAVNEEKLTSEEFN